jgi:hypothetical protein
MVSKQCINTAQELAHFEWDENCDWLQVQCLEVDREHIINEYLKVQGEMEDELREQEMLQDGGGLIPDIENNLLGPLKPRGAVSKESSEYQGSNSTEYADNRYSNMHSCGKKPIEGQAPKDEEIYHF